MKRNKIISIFFFSIFFSSILFTACNNGNNDKSKSVLPKGDREYDDLARLMAGLKAEEGSQFAALQEIPKLKTHEHSFDTLWSKSEVIKYSDKMKDWRKAELGDDKNDTTSLFYPFSGPDRSEEHTSELQSRQYL